MSKPTAEEELERTVFNLWEASVAWDEIALKLNRPLSILLSYKGVKELYLNNYLNQLENNMKFNINLAEDCLFKDKSYKFYCNKCFAGSLEAITEREYIDLGKSLELS